MVNDPLKPGPGLLCKLASIAVHADELLSPLGHEVDKHALTQAMADGEVKEWLAAMGATGMAPVKRTFDDLRAAAARSQNKIKRGRSRVSTAHIGGQ